jgi:hypothetical protein
VSPTFDDFIDLMPLVAHRGWQVNENGRVRNEAGECPYCALVNEVYGQRIAHLMVNRPMLGIEAPPPESPIDGAKLLVWAADRPEDPDRQRLLAALGLTKEAS